jgi:hypothetical protein
MLWSWMWCPKLMFCSTMADLSHVFLHTAFSASCWFLVWLTLQPWKDGGVTFLQNVDWLSPHYTAFVYPRRQNSSQPPMWDHQILIIINCFTWIPFWSIHQYFIIVLSLVIAAYSPLNVTLRKVTNPQLDIKLANPLNQSRWSSTRWVASWCSTEGGETLV